MKKLVIILSTFILLTSVFLLSSCKPKAKNGDFNFDDKYFIGVQEHFYEIRNMEPAVTHEFVKDMISALDMKVFRLNVTMNNLF